MRKRVKLQDQPFQVLAMLLERPGEVLTREELRQKLWPTDTFVDFDHGLNNAINRLRDALNDSAEAPRFIETLPKRGYRFISQIESEVIPDLLVVTEKSLGLSGNDAPRALLPWWRSRWVALGTAVLALSLLFGLAVNIWKGRFSSSAHAMRIEAIAVLPLENLTGDPSQEYFADGMTDALITNLAQVGSLRVMSRASTMRYKGALGPLADVARKLNVASGIGGGAGITGLVNTGAVNDSSLILGNQNDSGANRGVSDFDRTHRFVLSYLWDLPKPQFAERSRFARSATWDWRSSAIVTAMSGGSVNSFV